MKSRSGILRFVSNKCDALAFQTEAKVNTRGCFVEVRQRSLLPPFCCLTLLLVVLVGQPPAQDVDGEPLLPDDGCSAFFFPLCLVRGVKIFSS